MARPARPHFSDDDLDGQLAGTLLMAVVPAADLGEAMAAAARVDRPDRDRSHDSWAQAAAAAEDAAAGATAAGDRVNAHDAHLPASEYHRQSWYLLRSAPRAAAFEHRLAALVCDPAQPDMGARMAAHGLDDVGDHLRELRRYSMLSVTDRISCPVVVVEAEGDFAGGDEQALLAALAMPRDVVQLTAAQGAGGHCAGLGQQVWAAAVYPRLHRLLSAAPVPAGGGSR